METLFCSYTFIYVIHVLYSTNETYNLYYYIFIIYYYKPNMNLIV